MHIAGSVSAPEEEVENLQHFLTMSDARAVVRQSQKYGSMTHDARHPDKEVIIIVASRECNAFQALLLIANKQSLAGCSIIRIKMQ